jgi:hypothetical protein
MADMHIRSCIRFAARHKGVRRLMIYDAGRALAYAGHAPDGAAMAAETEADWLADGADEPTRIKYAAEVWPVINVMLAELKKRGAKL